MRIVISAAAVLMCAFSLDAQIVATLNRLPDGSTEIRMRNDSAVSLTAFALRMDYRTQASADNAPLMLYVDPEIDRFPPLSVHVTPLVTGPLLAGQEATLLPERMLAVNRTSGKPVFEQPVTAGIFADGSTTGDAALLTRMMLRRSNMLLAVETTLETLSDAGRRNIPRNQLIEEFKKTIDSMRRWYLPPEQQVGIGLYQSVIGKLMNLPEGQVGSPFPPAAFVAPETATLRQQRAALMESRPTLADATLAGNR